MRKTHYCALVIPISGGSQNTIHLLEMGGMYTSIEGLAIAFAARLGVPGEVDPQHRKRPEPPGAYAYFNGYEQALVG